VKHQSPSTLREQAEKFRKLASTINDCVVADAMQAIAQEFEAEAEALERASARDG
jgi:hypothetical protein